MVRNVGDLSISKGRTMVSTAEGEMFRLSPNDDLIAAGIGAMASEEEAHTNLSCVRKHNIK